MMIASRTTSGLLCGFAALWALAGAARADVLHDTMGMIDSQTYTSGGANVIGGTPTILDVQVADDFDVPAPGYSIDSVEAGFILNPASNNPPADGVWVQFYEDLGGTPSENLYLDYFATGSEVTATSFTETVFGWFGMKIGADLSASGISLPAGTWWVDIQPVDSTGNGLYSYQALDGSFTDGFSSYERDGAFDHGNGYATAYGSYDWFDYFGGGTMAFRVDGTAIPEPASALLLALAALPLLRRRA